MEIFISNLDSGWSRDGLRETLRPLLTPLDITAFHIQKPTGRTYAFLTIADFTKAKGLLAHISTKSLFLTSPSGRAAAFRASHKNADEKVVMAIQKDEKDARKRKTQIGIDSKTTSQRKADSNTSGIKFNLIECGHWVGRQFVPYWSRNTAGSLTRRKRELYFDISAAPRTEGQVKFNDVDSIVISSHDGQQWLIVQFHLAPKIFETSSGPSAGLLDLTELLELFNKFALYRCSKLPEADELLTGTCLTYRFRLESPMTMAALKSRLSAITSHQISLEQLISSQPATAQLSYTLHVEKLNALLRHPSWTFAVRFQILAYWRNSIMSISEVARLVPTLQQRYSHFPNNKLVTLLRRTRTYMEYADKHLRTAIDALELLKQHETTLIGDERHLITMSAGSRDEVSVHKVLVTPTGLYLHGPEEMVANRVLRKYRNHGDCFLRVTFGEEDGGRLEFSRDFSNDRILRGRFLAALEGGIPLAGRRFEFLGFSHSSLRAYTCWFMCPFIYEDDQPNSREVSAQSLIRSLGDFSSIRCPAKCAARIGQAFSETKVALTIAPNVLRRVPDIESGQHLFTDGCGTISRTIGKQLRRRLGRNENPTIYQIRYKGAKGVVSIDPRLVGDQLCLRPSMIKFEGSDSNDIEVCGTNAHPLPFRLNRQLIKILEDLGVRCHVFEKLQQDAISQLLTSTTSTSAAIDFVAMHLSDSSSRLPSLLRTLARENINATEDTFFRDILGALLQVELRQLKYKARIPVPDGRTLYGICDETGFLGENQVYVTFADGPNERRTRLRGKVAVTRSPALHPGDVQIVEAVIPPADSALSSLTNCIVFSSRGRRDIPSMLSGGDLDGDLFNIIFDRSLMPRKIYMAAEYAAAKPIQLSRPVTRSDITKFMLDFMQNDQLGRIATLHQVLADREEDGTASAQCVKLANLHSTAVDFSKTGVPVNVLQIPRAPDARPDFMRPSASMPVEKGIARAEVAAAPEDQRFSYYESERTLGCLYRAVDEDVFFSNLEDNRSSIFSYDSNENVLQDVWILIDDLVQPCSAWQVYQDVAIEVREYYEGTLLEIMTDHAVARTQYLTEKEVFIGNILGRDGSMNRLRHDQSDLMKTRFNRELRDIKTWMLDQVEGDEGQFINLAVACLYTAIKKPSGRTAGKKGPELRSFGWYIAGLCVPEILERPNRASDRKRDFSTRLRELALR